MSAMGNTGVLVDRARRRPILIAGDIGRGLVLLSIPVAASVGALRLRQLYIVGLVVGIFTLFFDVAYQSYLPALVDRRQLIEGNSKLEATRSISQLAGPGIAGAVIQLITAPFAVILDALSFFLSAGLLGTIRLRESASPRTEREPILSEIREGMAVVFGSPYLRSIAGCTGTGNLFFAAGHHPASAPGTDERDHAVLGLGYHAAGRVAGRRTRRCIRVADRHRDQRRGGDDGGPVGGPLAGPQSPDRPGECGMNAVLNAIWLTRPGGASPGLQARREAAAFERC